jgi:hypothetical protein
MVWHKKEERFGASIELKFNSPRDHNYLNLHKFTPLPERPEGIALLSALCHPFLRWFQPEHGTTPEILRTY